MNGMDKALVIVILLIILGIGYFAATEINFEHEMIRKGYTKGWHRSV